jgi:hypothetical protein
MRKIERLKREALEACVEALEQINHLAKHADDAANRLARLKEIANAAIAKAKGEKE